MKKKLLENGALALLSFSIAACTASQGADQALTRRLNDRGPISVSPNNPYLAGNLLLSKEMEQSQELAGFIKTRGAPASIEVSQGTFSPLNLRMYYPENREYFTAEKGDGIWIIKGPIILPEEKAAELARHAGRPAFQAGPSESSERVHSAADAFQNFPAHEETKAPEDLREHERIESKSAHQPESTATKTASKQIEIEEKPESILKANERHQAELTPRGDLVHYVTYSGETLSMLARWYTHDRANAGKIARINKLGEPNVLTIGDVVVIPGYMLKNKFRLTETAVENLSGGGAHGH
jgi:hypothetical protein